MITNSNTNSIYGNDFIHYPLHQEDLSEYDYDDYNSSPDDEIDEEAEFSREMNRTKASYMAFSHVLSEQYALLKDSNDIYDDNSITEGIVLDMIELKAKLCRDAVTSALKMEERRRKIREEIELRRKSTIRITPHLSKGAAEYHKRQDAKRMHSVMLKGGLLGFTPVKSHLPQKAAAYQQRQETKQRQSIMIKGGLLGLNDLIIGLTAAKVTMKRITLKRISSIARRVVR